MPKSRNTFKMKEIAYRLIAAFSFFTRLPFWRLANVPKEYYERVVPLWPLTGWLTGVAMAFVFSLISPISLYTSIILCFVVRVLITGALHEDGFADFCDGFGGGSTKERTLEIMKDSHIGTYGVLGLILYYLLQTTSLITMGNSINTAFDIAAILIIADSFCKWVSSTIIFFLPYARNEEEAKNKLVYAEVSTKEQVISFLLGILPMLLLFPLTEEISLFSFIVSIVMSIATAGLLFWLMKKKINGYTGDCCGATFIITEAAFMLGMVLTL